MVKSRFFMIVLLLLCLLWSVSGVEAKVTQLETMNMADVYTRARQMAKKYKARNVLVVLDIDNNGAYNLYSACNAVHILENKLVLMHLMMTNIVFHARLQSFHLSALSQFCLHFPDLFLLPI